MLSGQQVSTLITCPQCEAPGLVVWQEPEAMTAPEGIQRRIVSVHGNFHAEDPQPSFEETFLICETCGNQLRLS